MILHQFIVTPERLPSEGFSILVIIKNSYLTIKRAQLGPYISLENNIGSDQQYYYVQILI